MVQYLPAQAGDRFKLRASAVLRVGLENEGEIRRAICAMHELFRYKIVNLVVHAERIQHSGEGLDSDHQYQRSEVVVSLYASSEKKPKLDAEKGKPTTRQAREAETSPASPAELRQFEILGVRPGRAACPLILQGRHYELAASKGRILDCSLNRRHVATYPGVRFLHCTYTKEPPLYDMPAKLQLIMPLNLVQSIVVSHTDAKVWTLSVSFDTNAPKPTAGQVQSALGCRGGSVVSSGPLTVAKSPILSRHRWEKYYNEEDRPRISSPLVDAAFTMMSHAEAARHYAETAPADIEEKLESYLSRASASLGAESSALPSFLDDDMGAEDLSAKVDRAVSALSVENVTQMVKELSFQTATVAVQQAVAPLIHTQDQLVISVAAAERFAVSTQENFANIRAETRQNSQRIEEIAEEQKVSAASVDRKLDRLLEALGPKTHSRSRSRSRRRDRPDRAPPPDSDDEL
jgi:hypothetical protein